MTEYREILERLGISRKDISDLFCIKYESVRFDERMSRKTKVYIMKLKYVLKKLSLIKEDWEIDVWLNLRNKNLNNDTPLYCLKFGAIELVLEAIEKEKADA